MLFMARGQHRSPTAVPCVKSLPPGSVVLGPRAILPAQQLEHEGAHIRPSRDFVVRPAVDSYIAEAAIDDLMPEAVDCATRYAVLTLLPALAPLKYVSRDDPEIAKRVADATSPFSGRGISGAAQICRTPPRVTWHTLWHCA